MRFAIRCLWVVLSFYLTVLGYECVFASPSLKSGDRDDPPTKTKLYHSFDPHQLGEKYSLQFKGHKEFSAISNFVFTPPGRSFKLFRIKGNLPEDDLENLIESLQEDLLQLVKASGVEVIKEKNDVDDRPIALLKTLCPTYIVKISTLRGRHLSYQKGQATGDMDLMVFQFLESDDGKLQWCVVCAIHEPEAGQ